MGEVVTQLRIPSEAGKEFPGVVVAVIAGESDKGGPLVRWGSPRQEARPARVVWMENAPNWSACKGLRVVVGFEHGDQSKPIVLGLLDSPPDVVVAPAEPLSETAPSKYAMPKTLRIESEQELILECGKAKIALRADGRVAILGGYVLSRSKGVNKIKGGSVQIN